MKRLICRLVGHDWKPVYGYPANNYRQCYRCGQEGWYV